jgi:hypothetical protein
MYQNLMIVKAINNSDERKTLLERAKKKEVKKEKQKTEVKQKIEKKIKNLIFCMFVSSRKMLR